MTLLILGLVVLAVIAFMIAGGILVWVEKLFKIENPTYKNALKILAIFGISSVIVNIIFNIINLGFLSSILITVVSFFVFHYISKKYYLVSWLKSLGVYIVFGILGIIISIATIVPVRLYIFEPFTVGGESMNPVYNKGDYLLINKFDKSFVRGDVVVYKYPKDPRMLFIHRIIGLPLEKVAINGGKVMVNGQMLNESYYKGETFADTSVTLGSDEYFVLGDNRMKSSDSRIWGPITKSSIQGKIFYKISGLVK